MNDQLVKTETSGLSERPTNIETVFQQATPQSVKLTRLAAFTPANLTEAIALAKIISRSDLCPKEYRGKPENVLIGMQYAAELGVSPILALANISIINGRAGLWGDLFLGVIQVSPDYEYHKEYFEGDGEGLTAVCQMKRRNSELHTVKFGVADARIARLWGKEGPWKTNPKRMLQMRSRGFAGRDKFSDALKGLRIAEELIDIPPDSSDAKKAREQASLDVGTSGVDGLVPSTEANRGHNDTGLERSQPTTIEGESQESKKQEDWICSKCSGKNCHEETCEDYAAWKQDQKTSKPTTKGAYMLVDVEHKNKTTKDKKKKGAPFCVLQVVDTTNNHGKLYVWNPDFFEYFDQAKGVTIVVEVEENEKDKKKFYQVAHILEVGGVQFVNDKPSTSAPMAETQEREPGSDDDWDEA